MRLRGASVASQIVRARSDVVGALPLEAVLAELLLRACIRSFVGGSFLEIRAVTHNLARRVVVASLATKFVLAPGVFNHR